MTRKRIVACSIIAVMIALVGCQNGEIRHEHNELPMNEQKVSEIATEKATEHIKIDVATAPKEVRELKQKKTTEVKTEESTGDIDVNGYGWVQLKYSATYHIIDNHLTKSNGSIDVFGHHETWYSTNEPGQTVTAVDIPGKHVAEDGTIRDIDGYVCVASSDLPFYTILMTSVGPAKVYDTGCSRGIIDVYTTW